MDGCEQNEDKIVDAVSGNLPDDERRALETHVATCERCGREWAATREVWEALALVEAAGAPTPREATTAPHPTGIRPSRPRWWAAIAAALVIGLAGGYTAGALRGEPGSAAPGGQYLLLLRQPGPSLGSDVPPEAQLVSEYGRWAGDLARQDALLAAERLDDTDVRYLTPIGPGDRTTRVGAPHISGFFLVTLDQLAALEETDRLEPIRYRPSGSANRRGRSGPPR